MNDNNQKLAKLATKLIDILTPEILKLTKNYTTKTLFIYGKKQDDQTQWIVREASKDICPDYVFDYKIGDKTEAKKRGFTVYIELSEYN
jgi:hypothetical protein